MLRSFNQVMGSTVVLDTSLLVEFLMGTKTGAVLDVMVFKNPFITSVLLNPLALIEIYYIIRRKSTPERARAEVNKIRKIVQIVSLEDYLEIVGELKATTSIALADVASIALAEYKDVKVLFKHEEEIDEKLEHHSSDAFIRRIVFIEDFPSYKEIEKKFEKKP
ncbi:MAG: PIN domain-containing protein [Candidatus Sigynarchaeota archaeon]